MITRQKPLAEAASLFFDIPMDSLKSKSRKVEHVWPRMVCQWICDSAGLKKADIARFWDKDRTVIYNSVSRVEDRIETDKLRKKEVKDFMAFAKSFIKHGDSLRVKELKDG